MGACVSRDTEDLDRYSYPTLDIDNRWSAFKFNSADNSYLCIYDFQEASSKFIIPQFSFPLTDYSCICKNLQIYLAGGVNISTNAVVAKVWSSPLGAEIFELKRVTSMHSARCKPFLIPSIRDGFFAIAGFYHPKYTHSVSKDCERYIESEDRWEELTPLNYQPKYIIAFSNFIYAFKEFGNKQPFERFNIAGGRTWEVLKITAAFESIEATNNFCIAKTNNRLYIFGGMDNLKNSIKTIYSLELNTQQLRREPQLLQREMISIDCNVNSEDCSYSITKELRLCIFNKSEVKWIFTKTDIQREAYNQEINIKW